MQGVQREQESAQLSIVQWDVPFEILRGSYTRQRFAPHSHDTFALGAIESGASRIRFRGRSVSQRAGDIVVIPAGEVHTGESDAPHGWSYRMLYLPPELMRRVVPYDTTDVQAPTIADAELFRRVVELHTSLEAGVEPLRGQSALAELLHLLYARHGAQRPGGAAASLTGPVTRVREYLDEHFAKPVSLTELAALGGVSPFHLIRQFRLRYGLPPYMYLELVRVNRARQMLREGEPISRVAFATGFSDQSHLTRRFKRVVGVPPGQYARTHGVQRPRTLVRVA